MQTDQDLYLKAVQSYQKQDLANAEEVLRQILTLNPHHAQSLHLLGIIGIDVQRYDIAEELVRAAILEQNNNPNYHFTLGRILNRKDKKQEAISEYKIALDLNPDFVDAQNNLGIALLSLEKTEEAFEIFKAILHKYPENFNALCNSASIWYKKGNYEESIKLYEKALVINPQSPNVYYDIGRCLKQLGKTKEALEHFEHALNLQPDYTDALLNIGHIYREKGEFEKTLDFYEKVRSITANEEAYAGIIRVYLEQDNLSYALIEAENAEKKFPESIQILNYLGYINDKVMRYEEALDFYQRALSLDPEKADIYVNMASTYKNLGLLDKAIALQKKALSLLPDIPWIYSNILLTMLYASSVMPDELAKTARQFGKQVADPFCRTRPFDIDKDPERKLRVGYISPDFRNHAVNYFLSPIYMADKQNFEIFAYSKVEHEDEITNKLKEYFDHWRDIKYTSDDAAARMIENDKIDILVDPAGHTANNGLMIFARKPAPVQLTWLGYTATTGMKAMDYRITDPYAEPPGMTEHLNTETLWRLPDIFAAYSPNEKSPEVINHPPFEDNGFITFGCLNNFTKVTDPVIETWAKIMMQVPNSKLLMEISGIDNQKLKSEIEGRLTKYGLSKDRLVLVSYKRANQYVLYNKIDIALDPFPAVGGTTSMDTLWMGVPFVTLAGKHFASRMGVSILTNAGLPGLIAKDTEEYISIVVELAKDSEKLRHLRQGLRDRFAASPAMDQKRFAKNMEAAYREMWRIWVSKN